MNNKELIYFETILSKKIKNKNEINKMIKEKYNNYFSLTNVNSSNKINDIYSFNYEYQRYDSKLIYNNFEKQFYNLENSHSKTYFTNCGMSAIFSLLLSLKLNDKFNIVHSEDIYFETKKIINIFKLKKGKRIYYYDSISNSFDLNINIKESIIVIDTTCYHPSYYTDYINNLLLNNNIVILVRSHVKLDMLGLEYSYLGSISYLIPYNIDRKRFKLIKNIIQKAMDICGNVGLYAMENNIFPLLNEPKFINLNKERIIRINNNNEYFYNKIKNDNIRLHKHKLFLTLNVSSQDISELIEYVRNLSLESKGLFYYSSSFGFDYIALDTYFDLISKKNTIRISIGDVDKKIIDKFIDFFMEHIYDKI